MKMLARILVVIHIINCINGICSGAEYKRHEAWINITYIDPVTHIERTEKSEMGRYGQQHVENVEGVLVHVKTVDGENHGCTSLHNPIPDERWIALIERGKCRFTKKLRNALVKNAAAAVIYNNSDESELVYMENDVDDFASVFISMKDGYRIAALVDNGTRVYMRITVGKKTTVNVMTPGSLNRTSVLFVSISFIVLMIISLAWLAFYYIQRFRYVHAKERLSRRLMGAAKKAIAKMPTKSLRNDDKEIEAGFDQCAVCLEDYRASEVIRTLPCKHIFHKSCVDPWLIEHRSCPMCKLDILKAFGLQIQTGSRSSLTRGDAEHASTSLGVSEWLQALDDSNNDDYDRHDGVVHMVHYSTSALHSTPALLASADAQPSTSRTNDEGHIYRLFLSPSLQEEHATQTSDDSAVVTQPEAVCTCSTDNNCAESDTKKESVTTQEQCSVAASTTAAIADPHKPPPCCACKHKLRTAASSSTNQKAASGTNQDGGGGGDNEETRLLSMDSASTASSLSPPCDRHRDTGSDVIAAAASPSSSVQYLDPSSTSHLVESIQ